MKANVILFLAGAGLILPSCHHKDLEYYEPLASEIEVRFDWRNAPDASPESMALYMFDSNDNSELRYIFDNKEGGEIRAPFSSYSAICMNSDNTDWARMRNTDDIDDFEIYTSDVELLPAQGLQTRAIPRAKGTETERLAATPGEIWGSRTDNIRLTSTPGKQIITLYPEEAVCHYIVDVYDVKNLGYAAGATIDGILSGMAEGFHQGSGEGTDNPVSMTFSLSADLKDNCLHGEFMTFGECPHNAKRHVLTLYLLLSDNTKWYYTFEVTDQVTKADDAKHVHIIVRGLTLPEPINNGGGFKPNVEDWQTENVDLDMKT